MNNEKQRESLEKLQKDIDDLMVRCGVISDWDRQIKELSASWFATEAYEQGQRDAIDGNLCDNALQYLRSVRVVEELKHELRNSESNQTLNGEIQ